MGTYTQMPEGTFEQIQFDAGMILKTFDITGEKPVSNADIICATSGGINISVTDTFMDMGEDVDNCPPDILELKKLQRRETKISFTSIGLSPEQIKLGLAAADVLEDKVTLREDLKTEDFTPELWWVGDRGDGGLVAAKLSNVLSTGGFNLQTEKEGKGKVSVELTAHRTLKNQKVTPIEFYSKAPAMAAAAAQETV